MDSGLPAFIWEGVYASLEEVPVRGKGYSGDVWSQRCRERFMRLLEDSERDKPTYPSYPDTLLPVVAAMMPDTGDRPLRVLDYGGGPGFGFLALKNAALQPDVRFTVKEVPEVCELGRELFSDSKEIRFVEELDDASYDLVHLGSSIQYEPDWRRTLDRLSASCDGHLVITDLPAGRNPTYASSQKYYDSNLPCWFFNEREFTSHVEGGAMRLVLRAMCGAPVGGRRDLPQDNFPPEMRTGPSLNLIFRKMRAGGGQARPPRTEGASPT